MRMTVDVIATGKTTATVILTQDQVDAIRGVPGRARVLLAITYRNQVFRTSISVYRGQWMMVVNEAMRDGGMKPPGSYAVDVTVDTTERTVDVPDDLSSAIKVGGVEAAWGRQSYTNRKEFVRGVVEAKKAETRERRIQKVIEALRG
jgi:hypothetical protein